MALVLIFSPWDNQSSETTVVDNPDQRTNVVDDGLSAETTNQDLAEVETVHQAHSRLPDNWEQLTLEEKIALNPYGCNLEMTTVQADNGQCICEDRVIPLAGEHVANLCYYPEYEKLSPGVAAYGEDLGILNQQYKEQLFAYWRAHQDSWEDFEALQAQAENLTPDDYQERFNQLRADIRQRQGLEGYYDQVAALRLKHCDDNPSEVLDISKFCDFGVAPDAFVEEYAWLIEALRIDEYIGERLDLEQNYRLEEFRRLVDDIDDNGVGDYTPEQKAALERYIADVLPLIEEYGFDQYLQALEDLEDRYAIRAYISLAAEMRIKHFDKMWLVENGTFFEEHQVYFPFVAMGYGRIFGVNDSLVRRTLYERGILPTDI